MAKRIPIEAARQGRCAICQRIGSASEEHLIPSAAGFSSLVKWDYVLHASSGKPLSRRLTNGVCIKTICRYCNSLVGVKTDPALCRIINSYKFHKIQGKSPNGFSCKIEEALIISILQKTLASFNGNHPCLCEEIMRKIVLRWLKDDGFSLEDLDVYVWATSGRKFFFYHDAFIHPIETMPDNSFYGHVSDFGHFAAAIGKGELPLAKKINGKVGCEIHLPYAEEETFPVTSDQFGLVALAGDSFKTGFAGVPDGLLEIVRFSGIWKPPR